MPVFFSKSDITTLSVDAVVNAANPMLLPGGGVCGAIFEAAGYEQMCAACLALGGVKTGEAVHTPGFNLPAKYVIHTAGPVYEDGRHGERELLASCYRNSIQEASRLDCRSIAFPLISSGIYGYPPLEALKVAVSSCYATPEADDMTVTIIVFDSYLRKEYLNDGGASEWERSRLTPAASGLGEGEGECCIAARSQRSRKGKDIEGCERNDRLFMETVVKRVARLNKSNSDIYRLANIDTKYFSALLNCKTKVKRADALALCVALRYTEEEANELLGKMGWALSVDMALDAVVMRYLNARDWDISHINMELLERGLCQLGNDIKDQR